MKSIALVLGFLTLVYLLLNLLLSIRYRRLRRERESAGYGPQQFYEALKGEAKPEIIQTAYEFFEKWLPKSMPVLPTDDIRRVYGIDGGDIPAELQELADRCRVPRPSEEQAYAVKNVADVVRLLQLLGSADAATRGSMAPRG